MTCDKSSAHSLAANSVLAALYASPAAAGWVIAYSGGLDSSVLLQAAKLVADERGIELRAIHINHQLSSHAGEWQTHCQQACEDLGVAFSCVAVTVTNEGEGIEAAARKARYSVFETQLQVGEQLLLAHHLDDQAETLLLRLMRGSGPAGLAAMQPSRSLGDGQLQRPFLDISRTQLEAYASEYDLQWVEDDSNTSLAFDRNFLRHEIMPKLESRWPEFARRWQQSATLCGESALLDVQMGQQDLQSCDERQERCGWSLDLAALQLLSSFRFGNLLRFWLVDRGFSEPEQKHLRQVQTQLLEGRSDSVANVSWGRGDERLSLCCYRERFYLLPDFSPSDVLEPVQWRVTESLQLDGWVLSAEPAKDGVVLPVNVEVRFRSGGERCRPYGRGHSQSLKKLFQEYGVEPWLRQCLPLICVGGEIAAVADFWACSGFTSTTETSLEGAQTYRLRWQHL